MKLLFFSCLAFVCSTALAFGARAQSNRDAACDKVRSTVAGKFSALKVDLISMYFNQHADASGGQLAGETKKNEERLRYRAPERERYVIVIEQVDSVSRNVRDNKPKLTVVDRLTGQTMAFDLQAPKYEKSGAAYQYAGDGKLMPRSKMGIDGAQIASCKHESDDDSRFCLNKKDYSALIGLIGDKAPLVVQIPKNDRKAEALYTDLRKTSTPNACKMLNENLAANLYTGGIVNTPTAASGTGSDSGGTGID